MNFFKKVEVKLSMDMPFSRRLGGQIRPWNLGLIQLMVNGSKIQRLCLMGLVWTVARDSGL